MGQAERRCPICSEPALPRGEKGFPFCSPRCQVIDLGNWLDGEYRMSEPAVDTEYQRSDD